MAMEWAILGWSKGMSRTIIVIPCYNEAKRLSVANFARFVEDKGGIDFLFVDDGSKDDTQAVLERLQQQAPLRFSTYFLGKNQGKAEAVRQGCLAALAQGPDFFGYWDADLATPLEAIPEFLQVFQDHDEVELVCGARVKLLGRSIRRNPLRHYLGRVFATFASLTLGLSIYDTQCGAKLFRASPRMAAVLAAPFSNRWLLDVEILARLIAASRATGGTPVEQLIHEVPLCRWHDITGSKVKAIDFPRALVELASIYWRYLRPGAKGWEAMTGSTQTVVKEKRRAA